VVLITWVERSRSRLGYNVSCDGLWGLWGALGNDYFPLLNEFGDGWFINAW
jgi:hypothetical protein